MYNIYSIPCITAVTVVLPLRVVTHFSECYIHSQSEYTGATDPWHFS